MSFRATEHAGTREPVTAGVRVTGGTLVLDADDEWAVDTDRRAEADGYLVIDDDGDPAIDDAVGSGQAVVVVGSSDILTF